MQPGPSRTVKFLSRGEQGIFVGYSPSEKASPHSAAVVDAGTTVPGHPVPGPGRDASWEPRRRAIETVDSADGRGTAPTSSGVGRPRWACLGPNTKGQYALGTWRGILTRRKEVDVRPRPACRRSAR